jgi:hypothetical protein
MRSTITGLVTAALLAALIAAPAQATVRERGTYHDEWSFVEDCGFPVQVAGTSDGRITIREGKNKDAGAFPVLDRFSYSETWTNIETGEWFVIRGKGIFNEVGATRVEGSIFEFRAVETGQPYVVEDSDGNVVARNRGSLHIRFLFDTQGDDEPGGEWIADVDVWVAGPHPSLDVHPCEYAADLIG